jgi:site-specific recombinase XerD
MLVCAARSAYAGLSSRVTHSCRKDTMGLRSGECARLDVADLDLAAGTLLVRDGKGRKDRMVPVPGRAAAALAAYLRDVRPRLVVDPQ